MKAPNYPLYPVVLCFTLGYVLSPWTKSANVAFSGLLICLIFVGLLLTYRPHKGNELKSVFLYLLFVLIGICRYQHYYSLPKDHYHRVDLTIEDSPIFSLSVKKMVGENDFSYQYYADLIQVDETQTSGTVLLNHPKDSSRTPLEIGAIVVTKNLPIAIRPPRNPGAFDYRNYLKNIRILDQVQLQNEAYFSSPPETFSNLSDQLKRHIKQRLKESGLSTTSVAMLNALVLGERNYLGRELISQYADAGVIHILAISGLHIGILTYFLLLLTRPLQRFRHGQLLQFSLLLLFLWGYAYFTSLSASVVRAVTMFSALALTETLQRSKDSMLMLCLSFFVLLFCYPPYLKQIGFQMSYLAVFGILWMRPALAQFWAPNNWFLRKFWGITTVSVAAQLAVAPLSIYYFHQFPGLFLISNWFILSYFGFFLIGCMLLVFWVTMFSLPSVVTSVFDQTATTMNSVVGWIAAQEVFLFQQISVSIVLMLILYFVIIAGISLLKSPNRITATWFLLGLFMLQLNHIYENNQNEKVSQLSILHQHNGVLLFYEQGKELYYLSSQKDPTSLSAFENFVSSVDSDRILPLPIKNIFIHKGMSLLIIDHDIPIMLNNFNPMYILLSNNARVNLDRLLKRYTPKTVVSDGSNSPWIASRWRESCQKANITFHDTRLDGALQVSL